MGSSEKLCLQWNDFKENIKFAFKELRTDKEFTDVTLVYEDGKHIEVHKTVLVSSSPFFMEILKIHKHAHPLIYMRGLKSEDLMTVMDFLYHGEANVQEEDLDQFLALAEEFQLKGLTGGKEAPYADMTGHVEANHITGVSHSCNICGKISRTRKALGIHKLRNHNNDRTPNSMFCS